MPKLRLFLLVMNIEEIREYCLSFAGVEECTPFDENTLVYKVENKIFLFFGLEYSAEEVFVNVKCNPIYTDKLREKYKGVTPGYYANKKLWNSVKLVSDIKDSEIKKCVEHSYNEVIKSLPKKLQTKYKLNEVAFDL